MQGGRKREEGNGRFLLRVPTFLLASRLTLFTNSVRVTDRSYEDNYDI
jgi:hypothetical protein